MRAQQGWFEKDLHDSSKWIHYLSPAKLGDVHRAMAAARQAGLSLGGSDSKNFPLPALRPSFDRVLSELEDGFGFFVLRGLPAEKYAKDDLRLLYWGMGLHLGTAVTQSNRGDMLSDVRDFGVNTFAKKGRGYMSRQHLGFHADTCDVVCLMVLRVAKSGGLSRFSSSIAIQDEIARTRPDLLDILYQPFPMSWKGQGGAPGDGYLTLLPQNQTRMNITPHQLASPAAAGVSRQGGLHDTIARQGSSFAQRRAHCLHACNEKNRGLPRKPGSREKPATSLNLTIE